MSHGKRQRGAATIYVLLLASVLFGFLVFTVDVGRLYLIQAELQTAAEAASLAAATRLVGTANAPAHASDQVTAAFDSTTGNDNRFNLRLNPIGVTGTDLLSEIRVDYFSTLLDAQANSNGGQTGADARYVRVEVQAEAPVLFTRFLSPDRSPRQTVTVAAVAGLSAPICTACGIDALAVVAPPGYEEDEENYGFTLGEYYTLYLTPSQQRPNIPPCLSQTPAPLADTVATVHYIILNHLAAGPETELDGELFRLAAEGISSAPDLDPPGTIAIGAAELPKPDLQGATCAEANLVGRDIVCGLNTRFGVDPADNACVNITGAGELAALYAPDTDLGTTEALQDYSTEYDGNVRRVLTVALVDAADSLTVLNFRQFLIENAPGILGLNPAGFTGAFRAQYIGRRVPLRCGGVGGACGVSFGVGRVVGH